MFRTTVALYLHRAWGTPESLRATAASVPLRTTRIRPGRPLGRRQRRVDGRMAVPGSSPRHSCIHGGGSTLCPRLDLLSTGGCIGPY